MDLEEVLNLDELSLYGKKVTILYVEDDFEVRDVIVELLKKYFDSIQTAENGAIGLEKFSDLDPDIIITDIKMPVMDGNEMIKKIKEKKPTQNVIVTTGIQDNVKKMPLMRLGVTKFLEKPIDKNILYLRLYYMAKEVYDEKYS